MTGSEHPAGLGVIHGESSAINEVRQQVARVLARQKEGLRRLPPILILGETGTGKGLLAETLHRAGPRAGGPFVDLNCAAIPEALLEAELFGYERGAFTDARQARPGLFQAAHGGILFLDEIGLLPAVLQAKLLKAIEERVVRRLGGTRREAVDVWIVAATSEDLRSEVQARRFREDLYHRLAVVTLRLPPLRERAGDTERLAELFLARACQDYGLAPRTLDDGARVALRRYAWPGNVRELANAMERVALLSESPTVTAATLDLPAGPSFREAPGLSGPHAPVSHRPGPSAASEPGHDAEDAERARFREALDAEQGNLSRAAARLGLARNTLRYRLERLGLRAGAGEATAERSPAGTAGGEGPAGAGAGEPTTAVPVAAGLDPAAPRRLTFLRALLPAPDEAGPGTDRARVLDAVLEKMRSFGGWITGEDLLASTAAFGLEPQEDAPRRAAHAALAIRRALVAGRGGRAPVRMALHTEALPAAAGADPAGWARAGALLDGLLQRTDRGEISVSPAAAAFLRSRFRLEGPGPEASEAGHRLSGLADPERELSRFVGRDRELRLLDELFEQARDGQGQVVTIVAEPGMGKSRLVRELRRQLGDRAGWMEGRAMSGGRALPLAPLADLLQRVTRVEDADPEPAVIEKLERRVLDYGEGLRAVLPFLRYLLSVEPGDPAVAAMDPILRRAAILDAMRRLVFRAAERFPRVVVIEDVHWIDQGTEQWLRLLADGVSSRPLLLVLTTRPGQVSPFGDRTPDTRLALPALSRDDSARMACALLAAPTLPDALQRLIAEKAEGNPFFVEEVVRSLQEVGAVRRDGQELTVTGRVDEIAVPDTVQDVILARIERLPAGPRDLLEVAAVIGKDVPFDVLAEIADAPPDVIRHGLRQLQAAEFLSETSVYPEWEHTFKHALTHDVAYERLPAERRRTLHGRIVGAIERVHAGRLAEQVERLAFHALRGEEWAKALDYCRQAGARAVARSANVEAVASLEQALQALSHLPRGPGWMEVAIDVRFELRSALIPLGEVSRILGYLKEAETLATAAGDRRRLGWVSAYMTIYFLLSGEHQEALSAGERAVRLGDELGDDPLAAVGRAYLGHVFRELGLHERALQLFADVVRRLPGNQALERFGQAVQPVVYALSLGSLSRAAVGDIPEAILMAEEGLRISEAADRPFGMVLATVARAQILTVQRLADEALALVARAQRLIESRSLPLWSAWVLAVEGWAHALAGRFPEAVQALERALERGDRLPFLFGHSLWVIWLGLTHLLAGDLAAADRRASQAIALTRQRGEQGYEAWAHYLTGEVASRRSPPDVEGAVRTYQTALALAERLGMRPLAAHCHNALAAALEAAGRSAEAAGHQEVASAAYRALNLRAWPPAAPTRPAD